MSISAARKALKPAPVRHRCTGTLERQAYALGYRAVAGVDEVGRGCLFGPVFAAAVILHPDRPIAGLADSKLLDAARREELVQQIRQRAAAFAVSGADVYEVDRLNIHQASRLAMKRAVVRLPVAADCLLVDAVNIGLPLPQQSLIHGDARCRSIAAASILAKVERDACMAEWDRVFPEYGLARNKGYSTPEHLAALRRYGPTTLHRFSFAPVRAPQLELFAPGGVTRT
ncbi:MAG: ribonuclease HII [Bryobacterales bacterium]|nr:ribonuclease HII [Bryobacterales bacterium]